MESEKYPPDLLLAAIAPRNAATFAHGSEIGFVGMDFYAAGRGGVLGDVRADVVVAAFVFFAPEVLATAWDRSESVMPRRRAAEEFAECGHRWAPEHLPPGVDYDRLAQLLGAVVANASVAAAPVFAGHRLLSLPDDAAALVQHRVNSIRELRGALHGAAVLTVGLTPREAIAVRTPEWSAVFGWPEPSPDPGPLKERWQLAEARTDRMLGKHLAVLDDSEREELVALMKSLKFE
jgi:hypothetical protein